MSRHVDDDDKEKLVDLGRPKMGRLSYNEKKKILTLNIKLNLNMYLFNKL